MSSISIGTVASRPRALARLVSVKRTRFLARITSTRAFATSTSARVTSDFGLVPTSKKPRALRRLSSDRASAASATPTSRRAWRRSKYDWRTFWTTRSRTRSSSPDATRLPACASSTSADVFPKS